MTREEFEREERLFLEDCNENFVSRQRLEEFLEIHKDFIESSFKDRETSMNETIAGLQNEIFILQGECDALNDELEELKS